MSKAFGDKLRELLDKSGMSQNQLAKSIGYTQAAVSHWVDGSKSPNWEAVLKMAKVFGVRCQVFADAERNGEEEEGKATSSASSNPPEPAEEKKPKRGKKAT